LSKKSDSGVALELFPKPSDRGLFGLHLDYRLAGMDVVSRCAGKEYLEMEFGAIES
jgi:hypothetical protein